MRNMFEKLVGGGRLVSIVMALFGLILLLWPGHTLELAARIIGVGLLVAGLISCIAWVRRRHSVRGRAMNLAEGIVGVAAGLFVLLAPRFIVSILPVTVGLLIAVNGVVNLAQALELRRAAYGGWKAPLVMAVLTILLGGVIVMNPFSIAATTVAVIGAVLVYNGVSNLWISAKYNRYY